MESRTSLVLSCHGNGLWVRPSQKAFSASLEAVPPRQQWGLGRVGAVSGAHPWVQDQGSLLPITLFSPHAVPSTAASSLEWHVFPTVHHSVLQTLCRQTQMCRTRLLQPHQHPFNLQGEDTKPPPPERPSELHQPLLHRGASTAYVHVIAEGGVGTVLQPALVAHVVEDTRGYQGVVQHLAGWGVIQAQPPAPAERQRSQQHHHQPRTPVQRSSSG